MERTIQFELSEEAQKKARKSALELRGLVWNDNLSSSECSDEVCFFNDSIEIIINFSIENI